MIEARAASIGVGIASFKARTMRFQPDDKDLVAEYLTAQGKPTKSEEFDTANWPGFRERYFEEAVEWKRDQRLKSASSYFFL